jgi:hypothetical protein
MNSNPNQDAKTIIPTRMPLALALTLTITLALILTASPQARAQAPTPVTIPGVFSTGVDSSGNLLAAGQTDPHWTIASSPFGPTPALVAENTNGQASASGWINPKGQFDSIEPPGLYIYTLTFSLGGFDPSSAQISGEWVPLNQSQIYLNGIDTGYSNPASELRASDLFSITSGFVSGENELQFYVTEPVTPGPALEGLQVTIFSATADPVPEPGTMTLTLMFLFFVTAFRATLLRSLPPKATARQEAAKAFNRAATVRESV